MTNRSTLDLCPDCMADRVDRGPASGLQFSNGAWIGCTKCGLSISGPNEEILEAGWRAICRSTAVREIRDRPRPEDPEPF